MPTCFQLLIRLTLLWVAVWSAGSAPVQQTCVHCALPCSGARGLSKHQSVIVLVEDQETVHNVSSLYAGGRCSVPGCFQRGVRYVMKIYPRGDEGVLEPLYDKSDLQPDCEAQAVSIRINGAALSQSNKPLMVSLVCLFIFLYSD